MNIRHDDVVHYRDGEIPGSVDPDLPVCGDAMIPAVGPEFTTDQVNCWECKAIME